MKFQKIEFQVLILITTKNHFFLLTYYTVLTKCNTIHPIIYSDSSRSSISLDFHEVRQSSIFIPIVIKHSSTPPESTI